MAFLCSLLTYIYVFSVLVVSYISISLVLFLLVFQLSFSPVQTYVSTPFLILICVSILHWSILKSKLPFSLYIFLDYQYLSFIYFFVHIHFSYTLFRPSYSPLSFLFNLSDFLHGQALMLKHTPALCFGYLHWSQFSGVATRTYLSFIFSRC